MRQNKEERLQTRAIIAVYDLAFKSGIIDNDIIADCLEQKAIKGFLRINYGIRIHRPLQKLRSNELRYIQKKLRSHLNYKNKKQAETLTKNLLAELNISVLK